MSDEFDNVRYIGYIIGRCADCPWRGEDDDGDRKMIVCAYEDENVDMLEEICSCGMDESLPDPKDIPIPKWCPLEKIKPELERIMNWRFL